MSNQKEKWTAIGAALLGGAAFLLRFLLFKIGVDAKGLPVRWHPLTVGFAACAVVLIGMVLWIALRAKKAAVAAPQGMLAGLGSLAMAFGLGCTLWDGREVLPFFILILGIAAAAGMIFSAVSQVRSHQPDFICSGIFCLFMALYMVNRYQKWSQNPLLMESVPMLLAGVAMLLYGYQITAGSLSRCSDRSWLMTGGLGIFFCLAAASGGEGSVLALGGAVWMITGLWSGAAERVDRPC